MKNQLKHRRSVSLLLTFVMVVSLFYFVVPSQKAVAAVTDAPATQKRLIDNGDGTYTLALSVTGEAASSSTTQTTKANVILVLDTSNSMTGSSGGAGSPSRIQAEKDALTRNGGIIDNLLSQNVAGDPVKSDIIEIAVVNFGTRGTTAQTFTTNGTALKNTINGLATSTGTNWEEGLMRAQELATSIKTSQPNEDVYVIFLTDGEPTTHNGDYTVNTNYATEWGYASDNARAIVTAGHHFYGIFTWGSGTSSHYLSSLVQFAYTGTGNSNTALAPAYAQYFTDATDTQALIDALTQITHDITESVGYTNVELEDGVTQMTTSSVKTTAAGGVTGLKYYRSGGSYSTTANNGLGEEWAGAPDATVNSSGEVDWNLGNMILENGVTYTVTFTVWPSQESIDLVADLNNGIKSYDSLTGDQKAQISVSGGHYYLKTNTDYPSVTYSTVTTTTVDGETTTVISDPQTATIQNPDPVGLAESKLNAVKSWEDTLDPSQREEIEDVVLYLLVDGHYYYVDSEGEPLGVTLTEESNWTITDYISIAPGLMVTEDSPAYDPDVTQVTYGGKKYALLEAGHEYVFEESDINNHFELTAYTHHPMIMGTNSDGTPHIVDVVFTKDASGNITGIESVSELGDNLSATNTLKGGINITKKVVDENGSEIDNTDPFTVTVTMTDPNGSALPTKTAADGTSYTIDYRIYYGPNNPNYDAASGGGRSDHIYKTGTTFEETLYVGDTIRVVNVEDGTIYTVTETAPVGYEYVGTDYSIAYGSANTTPTPVAEDEDATVEGNSASYAVVTNKYTFGDLEVTKTVEVESGDEEQAKAKEFEFTFKLYENNTKAKELTGLKYNYTKTSSDGTTSTGKITEGGTFKLKDGENIVIEKLPEGSYYEIAETAASGYTTTKTGDTGTIVKNETAEAAFTNTYSVDSVIVDPPVKKDITGNENLYNKGNFTFVIANTSAPDGVTAPMPTNTSITNSATYELEDKQGYYEFGEIEFTSPGTYVYTVTESGSATGVTNDSETTKTITFVVTDNGEGALTVTPGTDSAVFTFTNVYKTGNLEISKTVENEADPEDATKFTFTVTFKDSTGAAVEGSFPYTIGETTGTISSGSTLQLGNGETAVITEIPDGVSYEVVETEVDGYTTTKTGDTGTISSETAGKAAFTNTYSADGETTITVTKELSGAAWPAGKTLTFTLAAANGGPLPEKTTATISVAGEVEFGPIAFTTADAGKSYVYTISENGFGDGWTSSGNVTATVNVVDNGDGTLGTNVTYTNNATIINTYEASGTAVIEVAKAVAGAAWPSGKTLTFTLTGNNAPMPETTTGTLTAPGTVSFGPITYSESDAGKTYTYTVSENGFGAGWTSSGDVTATVEVTDNGNGTLNAVVTYSPDNKTITNTYKATGSIDLKASKELVGRDWQDGETVEFTLLGPDGQEIQKKTIGTNGEITFSTINYTEADAGKTYEYTISETSTLPGGVTKSADITATVTVTDNGDGTLGTSVTYTADGKIINTYVAKPVKAQINVSKKIDGYIAGKDANGNVVDRTFTFTMTGPKIEDELSISVTTEGGVGGPKAFDEIEYTFDDMVDESGNHVTTKEFTYEVKETAGNDAGFTYDEKTYNVVVTVEDDLEGNLVVTDITKVDDTTNVNIVNEFVEESIDVQLHLTKVIEDQSNSAKDATFTFQLLDEEGNLVEEKTITTSGLTGSVDFTPITYNASGTYKYTLQEIAPVATTDTSDSGEDAAETPATDAVDTPSTEKETPADTSTDENAEQTEPAENTENAAEGSDTAAKADSGSTADTSTDENAEQTEPAENTGNAAEGSDTAAKADSGSTADTSTDENAEQTEPAENTENAGEGSDTASKADNGSTAGWTYDTKAYPVTITVSDNFETAKLEATVDIDGTETTELTVTNIYKAASTEATIEVYKEIDDKSGSAYETTFEFTLKDENGEVLGTASVEGPGKVSFDPIAYDKAGTYNYTITETQGNAGGYTYDTTEYPVVVTVEDVDGKLEATAVYGKESSTELTVTNIYDPEDATAELQARKVVEDKSGSAPDETFTFELQDADGNVVETVSRKNGGYVYFAALTFDKVGTYEYTIKEVSGNTAGYTYDTEGRAVTINVTDDEKGNLVASVEYLTDEGEAVITNVYKAEPVTVNFDVEKVVEGASENAEPVDFTFTLIDSEGKTLENVTVSGSGTAEFSEIKYEKAGTYEYTITEKNDGAPGYTYDDAQYSVKVTVSDNNGKLAADVKITKDGEAADKVVFTNTYEADSTKVDFNAKKTLVGRTLKEGEFEFVLEIDGKVVETVKNTAAGDITFATIEFDEEGTHTFKMYEVKGSLEGVTYDKNVYEGTIVITDNGEGKLEAEVQGNTDIRFINNFKQTPPPPPITGEGNGLMIWLMIMAVALTGVAGLVVFTRRRRKD